MEGTDFEGKTPRKWLIGQGWLFDELSMNGILCPTTDSPLGVCGASGQF